MADAALRPVWAEIDLAALRHNAGLLRRAAAGAELCAVVKADAYGHGAVPVARAALAAGASWLAVALVEEGAVLRDAGIDAPVLVLSEPPAGAMAEAVARRLTPTVYSTAGVAAADAAARRGGRRLVEVHLKVNTGMHRVGADLHEVAAVAAAVAAAPGLRLGALWTHLAVADGADAEDRRFTELQLRRLDEALAAVRAAGVQVPAVHAANSAATLLYPAARRDLVRCGIALYGVEPAPGLGPVVAEVAGACLRPVLSWKAQVSYVRRLGAGERPSYGRRRPLATDGLVATVPVGYADGVPRRLFEQGGSVLIGGCHRPLAGTVTMDQIVVDCGPAGDGPPVRVGDEVVLIGSQGQARLRAEDWAATLGTIGYEVLCGIGPRVPRRHLEPAP